jgi:hypothetical protein
MCGRQTERRCFTIHTLHIDCDSFMRLNFLFLQVPMVPLKVRSRASEGSS